jgi:hypothetical protein
MQFKDGVQATFTDLIALKPAHDMRSPWFAFQVAPSMLALANRFDHAGLLCDTPEQDQQRRLTSRQGMIDDGEQDEEDYEGQESIDYSWVKPGRVFRIYGIRTDTAQVIEANTEQMAKVCLCDLIS